MTTERRRRQHMSQDLHIAIAVDALGSKKMNILLESVNNSILKFLMASNVNVKIC